MTYPLTWIEWVDSSIGSGWRASHHDANIALIHTSGYLVYEDEEQVKLAQSIALNGNISDILCIPRVTIRRRKKLVEPK